LDDPRVSIDAKHLERALRVIRWANRTGCSAGAKHVGIVQSMLATCRLHDINPYACVVDVLQQRVGWHPASLAHQLTPRIWKEMSWNGDPDRSMTVSPIHRRSAALFAHMCNLGSYLRKRAADKSSGQQQLTC
jgi:hypothetical protein